MNSTNGKNLTGTACPGNANILDYHCPCVKQSPVGKSLEMVGVVKDQACVRPAALLIAYIVRLASRRGGGSLLAFKELPD